MREILTFYYVIGRAMLDIVANNEPMAINLLLESGGAGFGEPVDSPGAGREANPPPAEVGGEMTETDQPQEPSSAEKPPGENHRTGGEVDADPAEDELPPPEPGGPSSDQLRSIVEVTGVTEAEARGAMEMTGGHAEHAIQMLLGDVAIS